MVMTAPTLLNMTTVQRWQYHLGRKYKAIEQAYYPIVDELEQKLSDLKITDLPDFDLHEFSFIKQWQNGDCNAKDVLDVLKSMKPFDQVAEARLTRKLTNYMEFKKMDILCDYMIPARALIATNAVPLYSKFLGMLETFFTKLTEMEREQMKVTWISQAHKGDEYETIVQDITLNQTVCQLHYFIPGFNNSKYFMGDNILCLDEDQAQNAHVVHWIFAPKEYIDFLKKEFNIKDAMDILKESAYVSTMIKEYLK